MKCLVRLVVLMSLLALAPTPSLAATDGSSMEDAVEPGDTATVGEFDLTITNIAPDATDAVLEADPANSPPERGRAYVMISFEATNLGDVANDPGIELNYMAVGNGAVSYSSFGDECGTLPDDEFSAGYLEPRQTASLSVCFNIDEDDRETLIVFVESFIGENDDLVWFSLGNDLPTFEAGEIPDDAVSGNSAESLLEEDETGQIGDYLVTVLGVRPDATDIVLRDDPVIPAPAEGNQYFMVRVAVEYVGDGDDFGSPGWQLEYVAVSEDGTEYLNTIDTCSYAPDGVSHVGDLFPGAVVEYNVCWQLPTDDAESLIMRVDNLADRSADSLWFSLEETSS
jgi:hypothetical protein